MKYIDSLREGMRSSEVYLCKSKQIAQTKAGKDYGNLVLQDKTGTIDSKIWDLGSPGIWNFEAMDYVAVDADVTMFQGKPVEYPPDPCGRRRRVYSGRLSSGFYEGYSEDV